MYELIERIEVGSGGQTTITFNNIPQIYTDLYLVASPRNSQAFDTAVYLRPNGSTANLSNKRLYGTGTVTGSVSTLAMVGGAASAAYTANTFSNFSVHLPKYTSSSAKLFSATHVNENNGTEATQNLLANLWNDSSPITSIELALGSGGFAEFSTFTLYGVGRKQSIGLSSGFPKATGGQIALRNGYWIHTFNASDTFTPIEDMEAEYLVIAGGGGGAQGAGGAGGYRSSVPGELSGGNSPAEDPISLSAGTAYTVTVGAGGAQETGGNPPGDGNNSVFGTIVSIGGGKSAHIDVAGAGGSGGSAGGNSTGSLQIGGAGTFGQGFRGGNGPNNSGTSYRAAGGGGGAGENGGTGYSGSTGPAGKGGDGLPSSITGTSVYRGGGGGGAGLNGPNRALGGLGGGGNGVTSGFGQNGTANTGGGGGGGNDGGLGGSGVVIVRYKA